MTRTKRDLVLSPALPLPNRRTHPSVLNKPFADVCEAMGLGQLHYSTVNPDEQRRSIGKVIDLMQVREQRAGGTQHTPSGTQPAAGEGARSEPPKAAGGTQPK